jgi:hypothetical protein
MVTNLWAMGATAVIQHGTSIAERQEYIRKTLLPHDLNGVSCRCLTVQTSEKATRQL